MIVLTIAVVQFHKTKKLLLLAFLTCFTYALCYSLWKRANIIIYLYTGSIYVKNIYTHFSTSHKVASSWIEYQYMYLIQMVMKEMEFQSRVICSLVTCIKELALMIKINIWKKHSLSWVTKKFPKESYYYFFFLLSQKQFSIIWYHLTVFVFVLIFSLNHLYSVNNSSKTMKMTSVIGTLATRPYLSRWPSVRRSWRRKSVFLNHMVRISPAKNKPRRKRETRRS